MVISLFCVSMKFSRVIREMKTITTDDNNNNKLKRRILTTTINTFSQEFLHISIKCLVTLLLLDYIAQRRRSNRTRLVTVLDHFYELIYVKKDADLDSRQVDTCSSTSVRWNSTNFFVLIKFVSKQEIKTSKMSCVYLDVFPIKRRHRS